MSTTEERAQMLYDKALTELNTYLEDMKTKPPQEIINSAYQIVNKQDLLMILESAEFTPAELNVLNELDHPLQVLYEEWLPVEDRHMDELRDSVQSYLDTRLQYRAEKLYADPSVFRYEGSYSEAREKGEVHLYRANRKRDRACIDAFTENISDANEARRMREFVQEWTQEFVNSCWATLSSVPTGTDGTLLHPSVKPPKRTITLRRNMTRFRSSTRTRIPAW